MGAFISTVQRWTPKLIIAFLATSAIVGIALIIYATQIGPWAFSDATTYLWTAQNMATGKGLVMQDSRGAYHPLTWHPPLFSILLGLPIALGVEALQAARWMNAIFFGITIFVGGYATWRFTRSILAVISVTALSVFAIDMLFVFSGAMSEATFFVLGMSGLYLLLESVKSDKPALMGIAGLFAGLSYLARYAGIVFVGTVIIIAFIAHRGNIWQRVKKTLPVFLSAMLIPAVWSLYVFISNRTLGGRNLLSGENLRTDFGSYIDQFWNVITAWIPFILRGNHILPAPWKFGLGLLAILVILTLSLWGLRKRGISLEERPHLLWLATLGLLFFTYLSFHILSYIFSSAAPAIDRRLLSPLLLSSILLLGAIFSLPGANAQKTFRPAEWLLVAYMLVSLFYFQGRLQAFLYEQHNFGLGYTSKRWQDSELIRQAARLDPQVTLAANDFALLLFYTGRFPYAIDLPNAAEGQTGLPEETAYLVLFRSHALFRFGEEGDVYLKQLSTRCEILYEDSEGYICNWQN
jgi:hypothetical protein